VRFRWDQALEEPQRDGRYLVEDEAVLQEREIVRHRALEPDGLRLELLVRVVKVDDEVVDDFEENTSSRF